MKLGNVTAGASSSAAGVAAGLLAYEQISQAIPGVAGQVIGGVVCVGMIVAGFLLPNISLGQTAPTKP